MCEVDFDRVRAKRGKEEGMYLGRNRGEEKQRIESKERRNQPDSQQN